MKRYIQKALAELLARFGYRLDRLQSWNSINVDCLPGALIDVGCAEATPALYSRFPNTPILMVDPLHEYEAQMRRIAGETGGAYELVALGATEGQLDINVNLDRPVRSSIYSRTALTQTDHRYETRQVPVQTLDSVLAKHNFDAPFGLKIDAEGFEMEVLKGSVRTLEDCCFVIVEASVQSRFEGSYTFEELVGFMSERRFCIGNILSADTDGKGLVRYVDLLFVPQGLRHDAT